MKRYIKGYVALLLSVIMILSNLNVVGWAESSENVGVEEITMPEETVEEETTEEVEETELSGELSVEEVELVSGMDMYRILLCIDKNYLYNDYCYILK